MLLLKSFKKIYPDRSMVQARPSADGFPPQRRTRRLHFHYALRFRHLNTRTYVRLLGPCFKTGRLKPFCQHIEHVCGFFAPCTLRHTALYQSRTTATRTNKGAQPKEARAFRLIKSLGRTDGIGRGLNIQPQPDYLPPAFLPPTQSDRC